LRRDRLGFVFQAFNLLPTLTAEENITLPADLAGRTPDWAWFDTVVAKLDLGSRLRHRPSELSGGQQQRVAVGRALISRPEVVFADEPTGALDSRASTELLRFLRSVVDDLGQTVVMVTHDPGAAAYADRVVFLVDGRKASLLRRFFGNERHSDGGYDGNPGGNPKEPAPMQRRHVPQTKKNEARQQSRAEGVDQKSAGIDHETKDARETSPLGFRKPSSVDLNHSRRAERLEIAIESTDEQKQRQHARKRGEPEEDIHDHRPSGTD